jgi:N-methylhydantoinase A
VARKLRIPRVVFPVAAGVMSALGLLASPLAFEVAQTREVFLQDLDVAQFARHFEALEVRAKAPLRDAGLHDAQIQIVRHLDMRYQGQGHEIEVTLPDADNLEQAFTRLPALFVERYRYLYAFATLQAPLVVTNWKVEACGPEPGLKSGYQVSAAGDPEVAGKGRRQAYFADAGWVQTPVYDRYALQPGASVTGPALLEERESTVVVGPRERVSVDAQFNLVAELESPAAISEQAHE